MKDPNEELWEQCKETSYLDKIDEYKTLEEKDNFFKLNQRIETYLDINNLLDYFGRHREQKSLIFRGVKKAKYKLYSTAHRQLAKSSTYDIYPRYVTRRIREYKLWNQRTIPRYLKKIGIAEENDLALLSYAQHEGLPTPLIDFSWNPFVALYFAMEKSISESSSTEIDQYASVYFVNPDWHVFDGHKNLFDQLINTSENSKVTFDHLQNIPYFILNFNDDRYKLLNNMNIVNQEGLFLCYNGFGRSLEQQFLIDTGFAVKTNRLPMGEYRICGCYNINLTHREYILDRLGVMGIHKHFVYPKPQRLLDGKDFNDFSKNHLLPEMVAVRPDP